MAAAEVLGRGFDAVLPSRSALRRTGMPAQARGVSFAEGVRGDARKYLTRARRERRAERVARLLGSRESTRGWKFSELQ